MENPMWAYIFKPRNTERSLPDLLSDLPIFDELGRGELKQIARMLHQRAYGKNETVFNESEPGAGLYIVESGRVAITKPVENAAPVVLAEIEAGNFFGELALIDEIPRSATAIAVEETSLLALPKPDLDRLINRQPRLAVKVLLNLSRLITQRLVDANEKLRSIQEIGD